MLRNKYGDQIMFAKIAYMSFKIIDHKYVV